MAKLKDFTYLVLSLLENDPLTFKELKDSLETDWNSLNALLHTLQKRGYIGRFGTRRHFQYVITLKGLVKLYSYRIKKMLEGLFL